MDNEWLAALNSNRAFIPRWVLVCFLSKSHTKLDFNLKDFKLGFYLTILYEIFFLQDFYYRKRAGSSQGNSISRFVSDYRWSAYSWFFINIDLTSSESTKPNRINLWIQNIPTGRNSSFVTVDWTFPFCMKSTNTRMHFMFGWILNWCSYYKNALNGKYPLYQ